MLPEELSERKMEAFTDWLGWTVWKEWLLMRTLWLKLPVAPSTTLMALTDFLPARP